MPVAARTLSIFRAGAMLSTIALGAMTLRAAVVECKRPPQVVAENYSPQFAGVRSVTEAENLIRSKLPLNFTQRQVVDATDAFVRARFYHVVAQHRSCGGNWAAELLGAVLPRFRNLVSPDSILGGPNAYCTQQTLVFNAILARFQIPYAYVRFGGRHMAPAAQLDGEWKLYDSDMEMQPRSIRLKDILEDRVSFGVIYPSNRAGAFGEMAAVLQQAGPISVEAVNGNPARLGQAADTLLEFVSRFGWLLSAFITVALFGRSLVPRGLRRNSQLRHTAGPPLFPSPGESAA